MKKAFFLAAWLLGSPVMPALAETPDLTFTDLLQAPDGAKADWPSLSGKVVVVNFWATWCVPCVAEIPLLNALASGTDPAKVQIIAADYNGENRAKVAAFLKKHPISGWIGLDTAKETQRHFGVSYIPVTFIIGPDGKLVHKTGHLETIKAEQLTALAEGKAVTFDDTVKAGAGLLADQKKLAAEAEKTKIDSFMATNGKMLANAPGILLSEAASAPDDGLPADLARTAIWTPGRFDLLSHRLQDLVGHAFKIPATRVAVSGADPEKRYNLHVEMPGASPKAIRQAIEQALASGLGVHAKPQTPTHDVLILTAAAETASHLDKTAPQPQSYCAFMPIPPDKAVTCVSGPIGELADAVEEALQTPVLNETKLTGTVTGSIPLGSLSQTLQKDFGFTLTPAKRPLKMIIVSRS